MFKTNNAINKIIGNKRIITSDKISKNQQRVTVSSFKVREPYVIKVIKGAGAQIIKKEYASDKYGVPIVEYIVKGDSKKLQNVADNTPFKHDGEIWYVDIWS